MGEMWTGEILWFFNCTRSFSHHIPTAQNFPSFLLLLLALFPVKINSPLRNKSIQIYREKIKKTWIYADWNSWIILLHCGEYDYCHSNEKNKKDSYNLIAWRECHRNFQTKEEKKLIPAYSNHLTVKLFKPIRTCIWISCIHPTTLFVVIMTMLLIMTSYNLSICDYPHLNGFLVDGDRNNRPLRCLLTLTCHNVK